MPHPYGLSRRLCTRACGKGPTWLDKKRVTHVLVMVVMVVDVELWSYFRFVLLMSQLTACQHARGRMHTILYHGQIVQTSLSNKRYPSRDTNHNTPQPVRATTPRAPDCRAVLLSQLPTVKNSQLLTRGDSQKCCRRSNRINQPLRL